VLVALLEARRAYLAPMTTPFITTATQPVEGVEMPTEGIVIPPTPPPLDAFAAIEPTTPNLLHKELIIAAPRCTQGTTLLCEQPRSSHYSSGNNKRWLCPNTRKQVTQQYHSLVLHWPYNYISVGLTLKDARWYCCIVMADADLDKYPSGF
jgi:hypothetical protein